MDTGLQSAVGAAPLTVGFWIGLVVGAVGLIALAAVAVAVLRSRSEVPAWGAVPVEHRRRFSQRLVPLFLVGTVVVAGSIVVCVVIDVRAGGATPDSLGGTFFLVGMLCQFLLQVIILRTTYVAFTSDGFVHRSGAGPVQSIRYDEIVSHRLTGRGWVATLVVRDAHGTVVTLSPGRMDLRPLTERLVDGEHAG